jgi:hypothetical protein
MVSKSNVRGLAQESLHVFEVPGVEVTPAVAPAADDPLFVYGAIVGPLSPAR